MWLIAVKPPRAGHDLDPVRLVTRPKSNVIPVHRVTSVSAKELPVCMISNVPVGDRVELPVWGGKKRWILLFLLRQRLL